MKKILALIAVTALVLSLSACFMPSSSSDSSTDDQANAADVSSYDKDFDGLVQYIKDRNSGCEEQEIYYDLLGAEKGVRLVLNKNAYVEIYDFSGVVEKNATSDSADAEKAQDIINQVRENDKFRAFEDGIDLTAAITESGRYIIAWDATRSYDYDKKVSTDELKENW